MSTTPKASPRRLIAVLHLSSSQSSAKMTARSAAKRSRDTACIAETHALSDTVSCWTRTYRHETFPTIQACALLRAMAWL